MVTASETEIFKKPYSYPHTEKPNTPTVFDFCDRQCDETFNVENRLERINNQDSQATTFLYDFDGNLVEKKSAAATIHYVYAGGPAPLAEINVGASTEKDYIRVKPRQIVVSVGGGLKS
jgi:YD repeat-containing protein